MVDIPYDYYTDGTYDYVAMFTITTIISDSADHISRGVPYDTLCERLFKNTLGTVTVTNSMGNRIFYRHVPVPYYGVGTYDAALANYYETYVTFPYPTFCGPDVTITVRFTVDHDRLQSAEQVFKSFSRNGINMDTDSVRLPSFNSRFAEPCDPTDEEDDIDCEIYRDDELVEESG